MIVSRRAQRFADLLDAHAAGREVDAGDGLVRMVVIGDALAALPSPALDPQAAARMRQRLVAVASVQDDLPATETRRATVSTRSRRIATVALGSVTAVTAISGVGVAASNSLPGDPFYGVKRTVEALQLDLAGSDAAKGQRELEFAATRLGELQQLGVTDSHAAALLHDMQLDTTAGATDLINAADQSKSTAPLTELGTFAQNQLARLLHLVSTPQLATAINSATSQLVTIEQQVTQRVNALATLPGGSGSGPGSPTAPATQSTRPGGRGNSPTSRPSQSPSVTSPPSGGTSPSSRPSSPVRSTGPTSILPSHSTGLPTTSLPLPSISLPTVSLPSTLPTKLPSKAPTKLPSLNRSAARHH